jgi:hypothetical protein
MGGPSVMQKNLIAVFVKYQATAVSSGTIGERGENG